MMKKTIKLSLIASASLALAACEQPTNTNDEVGTGDGVFSGDADRPADTDTMQDPNDMGPMLDPTAPSRTDELSNPPGQRDNMLEQPADPMRDAPQ